MYATATYTVRDAKRLWENAVISLDDVANTEMVPCSFSHYHHEICEQLQCWLKICDLSSIKAPSEQAWAGEARWMLSSTAICLEDAARQALDLQALIQAAKREGGHFWLLGSVAEHIASKMASETATALAAIYNAIEILDNNH